MDDINVNKVNSLILWVLGGLDGGCGSRMCMLIVSVWRKTKKIWCREDMVGLQNIPLWIQKWKFSINYWSLLNIQFNRNHTVCFPPRQPGRNSNLLKRNFIIKHRVSFFHLNVLQNIFYIIDLRTRSFSLAALYLTPSSTPAAASQRRRCATSDVYVNTATNAIPRNNISIEIFRSIWLFFCRKTGLPTSKTDTHTHTKVHEAAKWKIIF